MAKTFRKFTKEHRAKISAAAKKRWAKKPTAVSLIKSISDYDPTFAAEGATIGSTLRVNINRNTDGLISRMTQAIDKIETQIKRLESL